MSYTLTIGGVSLPLSLYIHTHIWECTNVWTGVLLKLLIERQEDTLS